MTPPMHVFRQDTRAPRKGARSVRLLAQSLASLAWGVKISAEYGLLDSLLRRRRNAVDRKVPRTSADKLKQAMCRLLGAQEEYHSKRP